MTIPHTGYRSMRLGLGLLTALAAAPDAEAAYSLKTTFPNGNGGGRAGTAVAAIGPNVLVGVPGANRVDMRDRLSGAVVRSFTSPTNAAGDEFGASIATVGDGLLLVGAPGEDDGGNANAGVAYLFDVATGDVVHRFSKPVTPTANSGFGGTVALGWFHVYIAASGDDIDGTDAGAVYAFERASPYGYVQRIANPTPAAGDLFGLAMLGGAFGSLLVSAPGDDIAALDSGAVYSYVPQVTAPYTQGLFATYTNPTAAAHAHFGWALSSGPTLGGTGTFLAGAPFEAGSGRVHAVNVTTHAAAATLQRPGGGAGFDVFGATVTQANGNIVVGAPGADVGAMDTGEVYVFRVGGGCGQPLCALVTLPNPTPVASDSFGGALAGGTRFVTGAVGDDVGAADGGAAYLFETSYPTTCWTSAPATAVGAWDPPQSLPVSATHLTLLDTADDAGKILFFHGHGATPTFVWDAATQTVSSSGTATGGAFCGGHVILKDGRMMQVGGTPITFDPETAGGLDLNNVFDPVTTTWRTKRPMLFERWYPTATALGDGRVLVSQGTDGTFEGATVTRTTPELYDPARDCWRAVTPTSAVATQTYPFLFLLPDGTLFQAGRSSSGTMTRRFTMSLGPTDAACTDAASGTWSNVASSAINGSHGSAVLYRAGEHSGAGVAPAAKILKAGGIASGSATAVTERIDMTPGAETWSTSGSLNGAREHLNLVALPDGQVLAVGGSAAGVPVLGAELWDGSSTWTKMACASEPRMYHSSATLLPDGRVFTAGGDPLFGGTDYLSYQVYSPPYLFSASPRPTITSAPEEVYYTASFDVGIGTVAAGDIDRVVLIRPGSVTHSFDQSQRYVPVAFSVKNSSTLTVTAPASNGIAPEGRYMLFAVRDGVPSKAVFLTVAPSLAAMGAGYNAAGTADANDVEVLGDHAFLATENNGSGAEFQIVDVSNPAAPTLVGSYEVGAAVHQVHVDGNRAFLATADNARELIVLDVTNRAAPSFLGAFDADEGIDGLAVDAAGNTVLLGTRNNAGTGDTELYLLDVTNPGAIPAPVTYEVGASVNDIALHGETAYIATDDSSAEFQQLSLSVPGTITQVSAVNVAGSAVARGVDFHAGRLYGVTHNDGNAADFFVWNAPAGGPLTQIGSADLDTNNHAVRVYGGRAFVTASQASRGLTLVDVRNPAAPTRGSSVDTGGAVGGVAIDEGRAFVATADNAGELHVVSLGVDLEPHPTDVNDDGLVTTSCLGDSNTAGTSWCTQLDGLFTQASWRTVNRGVGLAPAFPVEGSWPDAFEQMPLALGNDAPEVVVLAFGTNDITFDIGIADFYGVPAVPSMLQSTINAYATLTAQAEAAGAEVFIALTPPRNEAANSRANHLTLHLNNMLRNTFPRERLIDFHTPMVVPSDYADDVHVNTAGQTKRAQAALREIEN